VSASPPPRPASRRLARKPEHFLFDLDDTLYPPSSGCFRLVAGRIHDYVRTRLGLEEQEARALQRRYWQEYGTSLRGLMVHHGVEPQAYLDYVHDVPVESRLAPDPALRAVLERLSGHRHVFSNGPEAYVRRVLRRLGVEDLFDRIFDIAACGYIPKPNAAPYALVARALGAADEACVLVDDAPANLAPAWRRGWFTVWLRAPESWAGGAPGLSVREAQAGVQADAVIASLAELPGVLARALAEGEATAGL
jgi:putative hydrolase of the HAD superfamily